MNAITYLFNQAKRPEPVVLDDSYSDFTDLPLAALTATMLRAVPSYLGLRIAILGIGSRVRITVIDREPAVRSSLRFSLAHIDRGRLPCGHITFFAANPGAFVDFAAGLERNLRWPPAELATVTPATNSAVAKEKSTGSDMCVVDAVMDGDLAQSIESGVAGLADLSVMNRAIGILIDQGLTIEQAFRALNLRPPQN